MRERSADQTSGLQQIDKFCARLQGGTLVNADIAQIGDVLVTDGVIEAVGPGLKVRHPFCPDPLMTP